MRYLLASLLLLGLGYLVRQRKHDWKHDKMKQSWLNEEYRASQTRGLDQICWRWPVRR